MAVLVQSPAVAKAAAIIVPLYPNLFTQLHLGGSVEFHWDEKCRITNGITEETESYAQAHIRVHDSIMEKLPKRLQHMVSSTTTIAKRSA